VPPTVRSKRPALVLGGAFVALVAVVLTGIGIGAFPLPPGAVVVTLLNRARDAIGDGPLSGGVGDTGGGVVLELRLRRVVLAGIAVASFLAAGQTLVQQQNTEDLREVYGWLLGQLGRSTWADVGMVLPYLGTAVVVLLLCGRALDVLAVGDDEASSLGVHPGRVRLLVILAASMATASAVAVSGLIGFVGLVVPHIARRFVGGSNARVLPLSLLIGGAFLVLADLVARVVLAPAELPIGVVTAFVGAPFFAGLLWLGARRR
jgi:iron complex transport system permease protein